MATRTCLFDLGNVLLFFSHDRMCRQIGQVVGRSSDDVRSQLLDSGLQGQFETGRVSAADVHRLLDELPDRQSRLADFEHACAAIFEPNAPMFDMVAELKEAGMRLVLLSNTCRSHYEFVKRHYDVLDHFDDLVLSYEVGEMKPAGRIYQAAAEKIQCEPAECFYTDDIAEYVVAARKFGLDGEVFHDADTTRQQLIQRGVLPN